jgi:hypothetical protein
VHAYSLGIDFPAVGYAELPQQYLIVSGRI